MNTAELEAKHPGYTKRWWIVAVVLAAEIVDLLDSTVVNVAGPTLRASLGTTPTQLQWVIGGYTLALGSGLIVGGRLGDRLGRRFMFLFGIAGFTIASLACAMAPSIELLIVFRVLQGFMGATVIPQGFGMILAAFPREEFGKAFAVYGPVFGIAGILGPIIGGGIIQANIFNLDWRAVFLVNLPIGIAAFAIAWMVVPRLPGNKKIELDFLGTAVVFASSGLLVWPLIQGQDAGWPLWTWLSLGASFVGFYLFVLLERRAAKSGHTPLVEPSVFKKRAFTYGLAGIAAYFGSLTGFALVMTLFLQLGHGYSAGEAGLANIPLTVGTAIGGALSGAFLGEKLGKKILPLGASITLLGVVSLAILVSTLDFNFWIIVPSLAITGLGSGLIVGSLFDIALGGVDSNESGSASGLLSSVQSVFGSVGVALSSAVFFNGFSFANIQNFDAASATRNALIVVALFVVAFLALSPKFPEPAKHD